MVKDVRPGISSSSPSNLIPLGDTLFFTANDGTNGTELWKSDGTEAGTTLAVELSPGSVSTSFVNNSFRAAGDKVFFVATPSGGVRQLFVSDGTLAGTESIFTSTSINNLTVTDSFLYFSSGNDLYAVPLFETLTPGDFDGDGDVDGADFVAWQTNYPKPSGASLAEGDANGDGKVDGADFAVWQDSFSSTPNGGSSPVPEPSTALLTLTAVVLLCTRRGWGKK
jgi:ELWxxDGT repeat protein